MSDLNEAKIYGKKPRFVYNAIDAYKQVECPNKWLDCPKCKLKPLVWEFDNGRSTACGCGENNYDHFSIHAESINSVYKHDNNTLNYNDDELRINWNHWVRTGEELFLHASKRKDSRY